MCIFTDVAIARLHIARQEGVYIYRKVCIFTDVAIARLHIARCVYNTDVAIARLYAHSHRYSTVKYHECRRYRTRINTSCRGPETTQGHLSRKL